MKAVCDICGYSTPDLKSKETDTLKVHEGHDDKGKEIYHTHRFLRAYMSIGDSVYFNCPLCVWVNCDQCRKSKPSNRGRVFDVSRHVKVT